MKPAIFHLEALRVIRSFPREVRRELGKAIFDVQLGQALQMPLCRPMPSVGRGVEELRIRDETGSYRVFYLARMERGVLIFHAFVKKSRQTPDRELELGRKRLKELLDE